MDEKNDGYVVLSGRIWKKRLLYNPQSGNMRIIERNDEKDQVNGFYGAFYGDILMLYRYGDALYLNINEKKVFV